MSIETDTMHHYAEIDRQQARDAAFESAQEDAAEELFDLLTQTVGENAAILLTDPAAQSGPHAYTPTDVTRALRDALTAFNARVDARATDKTARV